MKIRVAAYGLMLLLPLNALAQQKLSCQTGTEDRHARIAMELQKDKVKRFAYYSKWKPKTCSIEATRGDAYTKWSDKGAMTTVAMAKGTAIIEHDKGVYKITFKNVDREFYCGLDGEINGTVTVYKGKNECGLEGVMEEPVNTVEAKDGEEPKKQ
ncbi:MAG: hypothetical protein ACM3SS_10020 [Rhodospirillaceae bacterium]